MKTLEAVWTRSVVGLAAGLLLNCGGGSYGGDGGSNPPASLDISVDPETITLGESATITWNSNAGGCQASGAWDGAKPSDGSQTVTPEATGSFTYSLVCGGGGYRDSETGSATLTVTAAAMAGVFVGEACCMSSSEDFEVAGLTNAVGDQRVLAAGTHWVGEAGKTPVAYAACEDCLAGGRLENAPALRLVRISAQTLAGDADFDTLRGTFTTFLGNGFTLTVTIDAMGALSGADTNGCSLEGRVKPSRAANVFEVRHAVTGCGERDGLFVGEAALLPAEGDRPAGLLLSTSNARFAIGWRLAR